MITLNLPKKQVNAILVAVDSEIDYQLGLVSQTGNFTPL